MDLHDVAIFFDNDPLYDAYSGAYLFDGQTASFDDSSADGATNRRRVLTIAPDLALPARRAVQMYGDVWLVGTGTPDGFQGSVIRQHYTMKRATDKLALLTPNEALTGGVGVQAYVQKLYFKDISNQLTDAEYDTFWNVFVAPGEPAVEGTILLDADGRLYRVRGTYLPIEGLRVCQSDTLDTDAWQTAVFDTGEYDPITEKRGAGTASVNVIQLDTIKFYRMRHLSDPKLQPGDRTVLVPATLAVKPGQTFTMQGSTWRVLSAQAELDAKALHVRLA